MSLVMVGRGDLGVRKDFIEGVLLHISIWHIWIWREKHSRQREELEKFTKTTHALTTHYVPGTVLSVL